MTTPVPILVLDQVTKRFAGHTAVDGLSLSVATGAIYGLLGPNGAGKTTTIRMILDIIEPDAGSVRLFGEPSGGRTHTARIGYLPEERGLYRKMRVLDVLVFLAEVKGVERRAAGPRRPRGSSGWASLHGGCAVSTSCRRGCSRRCSSSRRSCTSRS